MSEELILRGAAGAAGPFLTLTKHLTPHLDDRAAQGRRSVQPALQL